MFDLHLHSLASDGKADFATVVRRLAEQPQLQLVSLTDHDAIIDSTRLAAQSERAWIGSELTTKHGTMTVDMLALNVRPDHEPLNTYLAARKIDRVNRFDRFGAALRAAGWAFDPPAEVYNNPQLAKPHVVAELRRHPDNADRLAALGAPVQMGHRREDDVIYNEVVDPLRIDGDMVISIEDAIALTHAAGGLAIVAHPGSRPMCAAPQRRHRPALPLPAGPALVSMGWRSSMKAPSIRRFATRSWPWLSPTTC